MCVWQDAQKMTTEVKAYLTDPDGYGVTLIQGEHQDKLAYVSERKRCLTTTAWQRGLG
jgi:hypothetical protein